MKQWRKLAALLLAGAMTATAFAGCGKSSGDDSSSKAEKTTVAEESSAAEPAETEAETEATTVHVSPTETVSSTLGTEISDINAMLNRESDSTNNYKAQLSNFLEEGDVVQSFTFIVYSEDGNTSLGDYKGGFGVSVTEDCSSATDEGWYQAPDFEQSYNSAYAEITWNVPTEIQSYIDPNGQVLFGHWWSNVQTVKLSSIVCTYTRTKEVPVDGTNSTSPSATLSYNDEAAKTVKIPISDLVGADDTLQTVTFDITGGGSLGKFTGAFGASVTEGASCETDKGWYQTENVCVFTDASNLSLTWIIPDDVKESIDNDGDLMLGFWWSDQGSITLDKVSVRYSNSTGATTTTEPKSNEEVSSGGEVAAVSGSTPTKEEVNAMSSAQIVENIKVGWNLGNTMDSYNTSSSDTETGWGNPKTTQAMIDAVQQAGFNAVRIPVTWGEHMSADGTIDGDWMARVKEIVDYAYQNGLYVILNVHHDDALWLTPTKDKLDSDKATLTNIWKQICAEFQDYDHRLIFEGMNEPRVIGSAEEWTGGTQESYDVINALYQAFVDTVRSSGGSNTDRTVIVSTYAQSVEKNAVNGLIVPKDDHVIVSLHIYAPWKFCGNEDSRSDWGSDADKKELDETFQYLSDTFISKGTPVIIDECGAINKNENTSARAAWYGYYISAAKQKGIKCFVWDEGEKKDGFALLNRKDCTWYYPEIIQAIQNAVQ